jgi:hypothetical protein
MLVKIRKMDGTWREVEGEVVHIKGFKGYEFLLHEAHSGWRASEASTGAVMVKGCESKKVALENLRAMLTSAGKEGLAQAIKDLEEKFPTGLLADTKVEPLGEADLATLRLATLGPVPYTDSLHGLLAKGLLHHVDGEAEITTTGRLWLEWEDQ